jgi:hypothetical protein
MGLFVTREIRFIWVTCRWRRESVFSLRPLTALIAFPLGFVAHFVITRRIQKHTK